jgi:hypothetical protein
LLLLSLVGCDTIKPPIDGDTDAEDSVAAGACLELSAASVDFGAVGYGELLSATVTLSNPCAEELVVSSIVVDAPFQVSPGYLSVQAGGFSTITVFVQPTSYGEFVSAVTLTTAEPSVGTGGVVEIPLTAVTIADADGDGYETVDAAGGTDCDDGDATINPAAEETWYDDVDQNCDGANDYDRDEDGYEAETDDHDVPAGMADCNDTDPSFNPGAEDTPYDNRDSNCDDANDYDYDGDGYESDDYGRGSDCDDADPLVNRDGREALNGKDDDCDGETDFDADASASEIFYGAEGNFDRVGYSLAIGDLDADGAAELIVGSPYYDAASGASNGRGGVSVFEGPDLLPTDTDIDNADNFIEGASGSDLIGTYLAVVGDYDGDGEDDLAIGASGVSSGGAAGGAVYLLAGEDARRGDLGDAMISVTGSAGAYLGRGIASDVDLDGDGLDELVLAYVSGSNNAVAVQYGDTSPTASLSPSSMDAKWTTDGAEVAFYRNMPVGADLDGDGYEDLLVSDGTGDFGSTSSGAAWALWGQGARYSASSAGDLDATATVIVRGDSTNDYDAWSTQLGDDVDGDGDAELWVYNAAEALYLIEGGTGRRSPVTPGTSSATLATFTWTSGDPDAELLRNAGDWDGDGVWDLFVFFEDASGSYGRVEIVPSSARGTTTMAAAIVGELGGGTDEDEGDNGNVGYGLPPLAGDLDGDGDLDMAVGDPEFDGNKGRAYVLLNKSGE